jgi:hypothetical protein
MSENEAIVQDGQGNFDKMGLPAEPDPASPEKSLGK